MRSDFTREDAVRLVLQYKAARHRFRDGSPMVEVRVERVQNEWEGVYENGEQHISVRASKEEVDLVHQCIEWHDAKKGIRVFLDDERPAPEGWVRTHTVEETITFVSTGHVTHLSLDHDLGRDDEVGTGYDVLLWLEREVALNGFRPPKYITVHSSNAGARPKMEAAIRSIREKS